MNYAVYADGACANNGRMDAEISGSFAVYALPENLEMANIHAELMGRTPLYHASRMDLLIPKGARPTNNLADVLSLHAALSWLCANNILIKGNRVTVFMDSPIILFQVTGIYTVRNARMREAQGCIRKLLEEQEKAAGCPVEDILSFDWIPGDLMKASIIGH